MILTRFFGENKMEIIRNDHIVKVLTIGSHIGLFYLFNNPKFLRMVFVEIVENFV
jgi:hypothetical protein